ncbi:MAG: hypothetical protein KGL63_04965 [Betaproteobacteria bacterium]|nr:hypothetical protein [Betaproteobacteria bacterium]
MDARILPAWFWWVVGVWTGALILFPEQIFAAIRYASVPFYALGLALGGH